jgi:hypothetical protein
VQDIEADVLVWTLDGHVVEQPRLPFSTTPHPNKDFFGREGDPYPTVYEMTWKEDCAAEDRRTQEGHDRGQVDRSEPGSD